MAQLQPILAPLKPGSRHRKTKRETFELATWFPAETTSMQADRQAEFFNLFPGILKRKLRRQHNHSQHQYRKRISGAKAPCNAFTKWKQKSMGIGRTFC
eukprot:scaffold58785_cov19-Tisochrysis_lutea.AAC.2